MAIVRQDAEIYGIADSAGVREQARSEAQEQMGSLDAADWAISRRSFLMGAGMTLATTSVLGSWLKEAVASTPAAALPAGFSTGVSDAFEELAHEGGELALHSFDALVAANANSL